MAKYTAFIPKEFFFEEMTNIQLFIVAIIILAVILFLGYKFYKSTDTRKKPESF